MVFSSLPIFLDPPNWNQHQAHDHSISGGAGGEPPQLLHSQPVAPPPPRPEPGMPSSSSTSQAGGSIRPGSMTDRARLAKIPMQPDQALKCPRCDSTNTKFCYFNNYSLSQPRHFCKTCRRYWTRGGALRNVPVGGGCRRNKRSKSSSSSKSHSAAPSSSATSSTSISATSVPPNLPQPPPQLPFMTSLLPDYGNPGLGLNFTAMQPMDDFPVGLDHWRLRQIQQFPFLGGTLDQSLQQPVAAAAAPHGLYPFDAEGEGFGGQAMPQVSSAGLITQLASVKMEDNPAAAGIGNLPRQHLGVPGNNDQFWGASGGGWVADLSSFNASTSGNLL